jgi:hypothetical protein
MGQKTVSHLIDSNILIYFLNNQLPAEAEAFLKQAMLNRASNRSNLSIHLIFPSRKSPHLLKFDLLIEFFIV